MNSLTLPRELVERTLLLLDTKSMLKCRLMNKEFNAIIHSSTLIQYHLVCDAAGVVDNPQSPLSSGERLAALKKREDAWTKLELVFDTIIKAIDQSSTFYELTAGNYFLGGRNWNNLYYCGLPSSAPPHPNDFFDTLQDDSQWSRIPDHGPGQGLSESIIEMGAAVYEHDLVVKVISSDDGDPNRESWERYSLDLVLLKFSTGEYHPLAHHPLIHVQRSPEFLIYTAVKIVGNSLALVVQDDDESHLFIFDWKTGHKRLQHKADETAYQYIVPVFVSPELLLVPNRTEAHFEVWHLFPSEASFPLQILSLKIPTVSDNYTIINIRCHGEPSPFLHSMPYFPPRPFLSSWKDSIIIISIIFEHRREDEGRISYQLIVHRHTLLDVIQKWTSPSHVEQGLLTMQTNHVAVYEVANPGDRSVRLSAQSCTYEGGLPLHPASPHGSPILAPSQISPTSTSHISADASPSSISSRSAFSTSPFDLGEVEWADWGPPISRWFLVNSRYGIQTWFDHQSAGQRYAFLVRHPLSASACRIFVADFNPHNVKKNAETMVQLRGRKGQDNGGKLSNSEKEEEEYELELLDHTMGVFSEDEDELEILDHKGVFSEEVYMGLKCVVYSTPDRNYLDAVMMDEERLLGLKLDNDGFGLHVQLIKVFYIG